MGLVKVVLIDPLFIEQLLLVLVLAENDILISRTWCKTIVTPYIK